MSPMGKTVRKKRERREAAEAAALSFNQAFGIAIRRLRRRAGVAVEDVAIACDKSLMAVYGYEQGRTSPRVEEMVLIAGALNVHPSELFLAMESKWFDLSHLDGPSPVRIYK